MPAPRGPDGGPVIPVQVTPEDFHSVATHINDSVATLGDIANRLNGVTTGAAGLAGVDNGAKQFDSGYLDAANTLFTGFDRAGQVLTDVALGIDLSGYNHWMADAAAVPGGGQEPPWGLVSGLYLPQNWQASSLIGKPAVALPAPLDALIPVGHHTLLLDVADRFSDARDAVDNLRNDIGNQLKELFANNSSQDLDALNEFWNTIGGASDTGILTALAAGCDQLSQALREFAGWITDTQDQILDQIISFTGKIALQTAIALIPALAESVLTDGIGGLPQLIGAIRDVGELGQLVAVVQAVEVAAAARLGAGILAIALDANTAMTAAINTTPTPNLEPTDPGSTTPSDASVEQAAEDAADEAGPASNENTTRALYNKLHVGRQREYRVVANDADLRALYKELTVGGEEISPGGYPGIRVRLPDGTVVSLREGSRSGGATIDIQWPDGTPQGKVHIDG